MTKEEQQETVDNLKMLREFGAALAMFREEQWADISKVLRDMSPFDIVCFFPYVMHWAMDSKIPPQEVYSHLEPDVEKRVREALDSLEEGIVFNDINAFLSTED